MTTENKPSGRGKEFYDAKGMSRYTMILSKNYKEKLKTIADQYKISQNAVIEVFLDSFVSQTVTIDPALKKKAIESAPVGRPPKNPAKTSINKMLDGMTPEQLAGVKRWMSEGK